MSKIKNDLHDRKKKPAVSKKPFFLVGLDGCVKGPLFDG
jgi:hypothetical protein